MIMPIIVRIDHRLTTAAVGWERVSQRLSITILCRLCWLLVREQTLLPVEELLGRLVDGLGLAVLHGHLPALLVADGLAVGPGLGLAAGAVLHLAREGVRHPHVGHLLRLVIPDLGTRNLDMPCQKNFS